MTNIPRKHASEADPKPAASGPPRRRYHRDALLAALAMLGAISAEAAALFAAIVAVRGERRGPAERAIDRDALATMLKVEADHALDRFLVDASDQIANALTLNVLDAQYRLGALCSHPRTTSMERRDAIRDELAIRVDTQTDRGGPILLSADFVTLLDEPLPPAPRSTCVPRLDQNGRRDIAMVVAILQSNVGGHLAIRRRLHAAREAADLAAILGDDDHIVQIYNGTGNGCLAAILSAELHASAAPPIVLIGNDLLTEKWTPDDDDWDEPDEPKREGSVSRLAKAIPRECAGVRGLYFWSVPERYVPSASLLPWLGGCIGPLHVDPSWARSIVAGHLGFAGLDTPRSSGVNALARRTTDPRDVGAMASMARAMATTGGCDLDEACVRIATSFAERRTSDPGGGQTFDPRLLVCAEEAHKLLARAKESAANGARLLAHGPPGSSKSAYVRELAERMAIPVRLTSPADFLAKAWGAIERLVRSLWTKAAEDGAVIVIDEFEVVGGRRTPGDMSNNALLIRSLTNSWLTAMDEFPNVPLLATTNDAAATDPAILRRFGFVLEFSDRLSPAQERLAWSVILGQDPPTTWKPIGSAIADFVLAKERCRMLGITTPAAFADSLRYAFEARTGSRLQIVLPKQARLH